MRITLPFPAPSDNSIAVDSINSRRRLLRSLAPDHPGRSVGKLTFVRKYDIDVGGKTMFWMGIVQL